MFLLTHCCWPSLHLCFGNPGMPPQHLSKPFRVIRFAPDACRSQGDDRRSRRGQRRRDVRIVNPPPATPAPTCHGHSLLSSRFKFIGCINGTTSTKREFPSPTAICCCSLSTLGTLLRFLGFLALARVLHVLCVSRSFASFRRMLIAPAGLPFLSRWPVNLATSSTSGRSKSSS